ncbi:MAG: hypothetical protein J5845_03325 [Lachnospiraceae bacterium]|nr:hypothetical protein [Lachnospiraceae bacterium]
MKESFEPVYADIVLLNTSDVITTSDGWNTTGGSDESDPNTQGGNP